MKLLSLGLSMNIQVTEEVLYRYITTDKSCCYCLQSCLLNDTKLTLLEVIKVSTLLDHWQNDYSLVTLEMLNVTIAEAKTHYSYTREHLTNGTGNFYISLKE